jgi:chromosome segregation ATPase
MKTKLGIILLVAICAGLVIALVTTQNHAKRQQEKAADIILDFSNQLVVANSSLDELRQVNLMLTNDIALSRQEVVTLSNNLTEAADTLTNTVFALQSAQDEITNLNARIASLEAQNQALDEHATSLSALITNLTAQIADTEHKLADSETNNTFLENELKRQMAEKAELEAKFNNLTVVRAQVKKLHEELVVTRRLQWIRAGTAANSQMKGAQLLMQRPAAATATNSSGSETGTYDLNVEVGSDGSVRIVPATNAPASTNSSKQ